MSFPFKIFELLNGCISDSLINTKFEDFEKLGVLFLDVWVLC